MYFSHALINIDVPRFSPRFSFLHSKPASIGGVTRIHAFFLQMRGASTFLILVQLSHIPSSLDI
jgi:hypothetical protein